MSDSAPTLQVSRVIRADAETLFQAWTDPQELMHWWRQQGMGWSFAGASLDLRVGGRYRLSMRSPDGTIVTAHGIYHEIERSERLVFTWDWEANSVGDTLVTVTFRRVDIEHTEVVLTHERFTDRARMGRHMQGWTELLTLLEQYASKPQAGRSAHDDHPGSD
jgi:uncharacterized protein YndB with AHSA1/START domain